MKPVIEVCLSPLLFPLFEKKGKVIVVIDILRATSTICTAIQNGALGVIPVEHLEECLALQGENIIKAAERNGKVADGFTFGNSPFEYSEEVIAGKFLALTTTNGTRSLRLSEGADQILVGSFLNLSAIINRLKILNQDTILFCAGWKDQFNLEDTLFAGAVIHELQGFFNDNNDPAYMAKRLYTQASGDLLEAVRHSSHYQRLAGHGVLKDIDYCLQFNQTDIVPILDQKSKIIIR